MNILAQSCGLMVLAVIMFIYVRQKKLGLKTERTFFIAMCTAIACLVFDILSLVAIRYSSILSEFAVMFFCKTYLILLVTVCFTGVIYVRSEIAGDSKRIDTGKSVMLLVWAIAAVAIIVLPIEYYDNPVDNIAYTYGPGTLATYAAVLIILLFIIEQIVVKGKNINPRRREAMLIWLAVWIMAGVTQFLNKEFLVVGFACSMGILIIYIKLENPEMNFDRDTSLYNMNSFNLYIRQLYERKNVFAIIVVNINKGDNKEISIDNMDMAKMEFVKYISGISSCKAFISSIDEFILVFENGKKAPEYIDMIKHRINQGFGRKKNIYLNKVKIMYIPSEILENGAEDVSGLLRYSVGHSQETTNHGVFVVDRKIISLMYKEHEMIGTIDDAIDNDKVVVYYQPIYATEEKRFVSAEALVRIKKDDGTIVMPGQFIDIAEKNGFIIKLGKIVFEKVCQFLSRNNPEALGIEYIEVNLSVVQCSYSNLAKDYIEIMKKYDVKPEWINLEITESASVEAKRVLLRNMRILMDFGVRFSLDDFGTGQSNLNYIVDMPVSIVKFDREMTTAYFENDKAKYVMDAAMHMIHGMNLKIVSEGIETEEQFNAMADLGISYIQGYYFSKPLPEEEFLRFISDNK